MSSNATPASVVVLRCGEKASPLRAFSAPVEATGHRRALRGGHRYVLHLGSAKDGKNHDASKPYLALAPRKTGTAP